MAERMKGVRDRDEEEEEEEELQEDLLPLKQVKALEKQQQTIRMLHKQTQGEEEEEQQEEPQQEQEQQSQDGKEQQGQNRLAKQRQMRQIKQERLPPQDPWNHHKEQWEGELTSDPLSLTPGRMDRVRDRDEEEEEVEEDLLPLKQMRALEEQHRVIRMLYKQTQEEEQEDEEEEEEEQHPRQQKQVKWKGEQTHRLKQKLQLQKHEEEEEVEEELLPHKQLKTLERQNRIIRMLYKEAQEEQEEEEDQHQERTPLKQERIEQEHRRQKQKQWIKQEQELEVEVEEEEMDELFPNKEIEALEKQSRMIQMLYREAREEEEDEEDQQQEGTQLKQERKEHRHMRQQTQEQQQHQEEEEDMDVLLPRKQIKATENRKMRMLHEETQGEEEEEEDQEETQQEQEQQSQDGKEQQEQNRQVKQRQMRQIKQELLPPQHPWNHHKEHQHWEQWQMTEEEGVQSQGEEELHLTSDPLRLSPDMFSGRKIMSVKDLEEEDLEDEEDDDDDMVGLIPSREKTREMEEQNRIILPLYEDSIQSDAAAVAAASAGFSSRGFTATSGFSEHSAAHTVPTLPHHSTHATGTFPSSSTPSLAPEGGGCAVVASAVKGILAQETSIHKALQLNLTLQQIFRSTLTKLKEALKKNQRMQAEVAGELESSGLSLVQEALQHTELAKRSNSDNREKKPAFMYARLCVPYFKDSSGMSAPMNEDGKMKVNKGYLDLYTIRSRPWLGREQCQLRKGVEREWKKKKINDVKQKIRELERKAKMLEQQEEEDAKAVEDTKKKLKKFTNELEEMEKTKPKDVTPPPRREPLDWNIISAQDFNGLRSAMECQLMWDNLLHPLVNRSVFTMEEDMTIQSLVKEGTATKDWDAIAKCLGTNRTGYLVMQRWVTFLEPTLRPAKWNSRDTKILIDAVNLLRRGDHVPWSQVHQHLPGYTRQQIHSRWKIVNPEKNSGHFSEEEDVIFIQGVHLFGIDFPKIACFLPGRTYGQVREKFKRVILPSLTTRPWTRKEDKILLSRGVGSNGGARNMIWYLPKRLPSENKCRLHALTLWQSISRAHIEECPPPPLFPVSITADANEVEHLRKLFREESLHDSKTLKKAVEDSIKDIKQEPLLQEMNVRRERLQRTNSGNMNERVQKILYAKGKRNPRGPFNPSMRHLLIDRFFESGRSVDVDFAAAGGPINSLRCLANMMLLRPRPEDEGKTRESARKRMREETEDEEEEESFMTPVDRDFWKRFVKIREEKQNEQKRKEDKTRRADDNTRSCSVADDEGNSSSSSGGGGGGGSKTMRDSVFDEVATMPLIPPNAATVGALHSLLLNRYVLSEMAAGEFVFQIFSPSDVTFLANMKENQLVTYFFQGDTMLLKNRALKSQQQKTDSDEEEKNECSEDTRKIENAPPSTTHTTTATSAPRKRGRPPLPWNPAKRKQRLKGASRIGVEDTEEEDNSSDIGSFDLSAAAQDSRAKIHITSQLKRPISKKKVIKVIEEHLKSSRLITYSRATLKPGMSDRGCQTQPQHPETHTQSQSTATTTSLPQEAIPPEATAGPSTSRGDIREEVNAEQTAARDKADQLLFHRMLSLFYWPMTMTLGGPAEWMLHKAQQKVNNTWTGETVKVKEEEEPEKKKTTNRYSREPGRGFQNIEAFKQYTEELKESLQETQNEVNAKCMMYKRITMENMKPSPLRKKGLKRKRPVEADEATVQSPRPKKDTPQPGSPKVMQPPAENTGVEVAAEEGPTRSEIKKLVVDVIRKKRTLKILNRSLRMKKVWEERRLGNLKQRRQKRQLPEYKPRGTRTRGCPQQQQLEVELMDEDDST